MHVCVVIITVCPQISFIKESLFLYGVTDYSCLEIFPAVANSAAFYEFIQEKQFVEKKGLFHQQHQLIIALLQHEEYDGNVPNQLKTAFFLISPFLDHEQSFLNLMRLVCFLYIMVISDDEGGDQAMPGDHQYQMKQSPSTWVQ